MKHDTTFEPLEPPRRNRRNIAEETSNGTRSHEDTKLKQLMILGIIAGQDLISGRSREHVRTYNRMVLGSSTLQKMADQESHAQ